MDARSIGVIEVFQQLYQRARYELGHKRFWRFLAGTVGGLITDLALFWALTKLTVQPGIANIFSATAGLLVVYFLVTKYAFGVDRRSAKFFIFVIWYATMILLWGAVIQILVTKFEVPALEAKILTVPFSFGINFVFSRILFGERLWIYLRQVRNSRKVD